MTVLEVESVSKTFPVFRELFECGKYGFSGLLKIVSSRSRQVWEIYLYRGKIVWAAGGNHEGRRWRRYIVKGNLPREFENELLLTKKNEEPVGYHFVTSKLQKQEISEAQAINLIEKIVLEIVFDLLVHSSVSDLRLLKSLTDDLTFSHLSVPVLNKAIILLNIEQVSTQVLKDWKDWERRGGVTISPNLSPVIAQPQKFQEMIPEKMYDKLSILFDGQKSMRDLGVTPNQDPGSLLRLIIPFYKLGIIDLVEIPDLVGKTAINTSNKENSPSFNIATDKPLVICVDDSPQVAKILEKVVKEAGGNFLGIQDPLLALPLLIERKPQLIFLDVIMPIINGYELCSQIRRVPGFKEIPIAILTGNDGVVDRVRAKMAGASCFVSKSDDASAITKLIQQHCRSTQFRTVLI